MFRQTLIHQLNMASEYSYLLSMEKIYQLANPNDKEDDIYKSNLPLGAARDAEVREKAGKIHRKFNKDAAEAFFEVATVISDDIMQPIIDSGKIKLTPGALIRHLDSKYLKTDASTIVTIYGEYFLLTLNEGDNVEKHIELLNAAANRIAQAGYKDFMHKVIHGIHLLMKLPPSWSSWVSSMQANALVRPELLEYDNISEEIIKQYHRLKLEANGETALYAHSSKYNKHNKSNNDSSHCTFCSRTGHNVDDCKYMKQASDEAKAKRTASKDYWDNKKKKAKKEANLEPKRPREHSFSANEELDNNKSATIAIEAHLQGEHTYGMRPQVANLALSAIKHKGTAPSERVRKYPTDTFLSLSSLSPLGSHATIDTQPSVPASQRFSSANYEVRAFKDNNMMREEFKEAQEIARKYPMSTFSLPSSLSPLGPYVISDIHHRQPPDPALLSLNNCNLVDQ